MCMNRIKTAFAAFPRTTELALLLICFLPYAVEKGQTESIAVYFGMIGVGGLLIHRFHKEGVASAIAKERGEEEESEPLDPGAEWFTG